MQGDFLINDWLVQPQINAVEKGEKRWHLEPKVMQVLVHLALHPDQVLSKERLIDAIWRDTFVGDDVLVRCISEIRYVFGDDARSPSVIQTIPKAGYRLIAAVTMEIATATELRIASDAAEYSNGLRHGEKSREGHTNVRESGSSVEVDDPAVAMDLDEPATFSEPQMELIPTESGIHMPEIDPEKEGLLRRNRLLLWSLLPVLFIGLLAGCSLYYWRSIHTSPFQAFWAPILETQEPALFCIADQNQYSFITLRDALEPARKVVLKDNLSAVIIDDLDTIVRVAGTLRTHGKQYRLKGEEMTSLTDLRNGPSIFVGAFDNAWTLRLTRSLRYHFANNSDMTQFRIVDSKDPSNSAWTIDRTQQMATNNYRDFAIVARFTDTNTGKPSVVIAGIGRGGTIAAGEFLTDPEDLAQLVRAIRLAGDKKNLEVVLSTQIIDGQPGTPKMEASYFW